MSFMLHDVVGWNPTIEDILVSARTESTNTTHAIENNHTNNSGTKVQGPEGHIGSSHVIGDGEIFILFCFILFHFILFTLFCYILSCTVVYSFLCFFIKPDYRSKMLKLFTVIIILDSFKIPKIVIMIFKII